MESNERETVNYTDLPEQAKSTNPPVVKEDVRSRLSVGPVAYEKLWVAMGAMRATAKTEDFAT